MGGCVSSSVHASMMDNARDKLAEAQREVDIARQRISAVEDEVRKVRAMDTSARVLHEQKLRIAAEKRLVARIKEDAAKDARLRAAHEEQKNRLGDAGAKAAGAMIQMF